MRIFITARYDDQRVQVDELCQAVRSAGLEDYCFVRDVPAIADPKTLWSRALSEIKRSDVLLIDVSDNPTGGRLAEAGMAFGLGIPVIVAVHSSITYKTFFDGIASLVINYHDIADITEALCSWKNEYASSARDS